MSITLATEDEVFDALISLLQVKFAGRDLSGDGFLGRQARMVAQAIVLFERAVENADKDAVPAFRQDADGTVLSNCSSAALDAWAIVYGLPTGQSGIYGRRVATGSSNGAGVPTCSVNGTVIAAGTQLTDPTGTVTVQTTAAITTDGPPNTVPVGLISVTTGKQANLSVGTVLTFTAPPANVGSTMTLSLPMTGAQDREEDGPLLSRLLFRFQNPPRGGTAADYRYWTEASTDANRNNASNDVVRAYVYPLRSGVGSVDVVPLLAGSGIARIPTVARMAAIQAYLNSVRPVTATVNAIYAGVGNVLRVRVRPIPAEKYAYDWYDAGVATTITAFNRGAKTISCTVPATLAAEVAAGKKPRVQLIISTSGAPAVPFQARVVGLVNGAPDVLTLDAFPDDDPTVATDYFYAGGPVVDVIAAGIQAYFDSLGPSRASGFADQNDPWISDVTLARLASVVMEARDTDGTRMVTTIPDLATTGALIAINAAAFIPSDFTPPDALGLPELALLRSGGIEVVQGV